MRPRLLLMNLVGTILKYLQVALWILFFYLVFRLIFKPLPAVESVFPFMVMSDGKSLMFVHAIGFCLIILRYLRTGSLLKLIPVMALVAMLLGLAWTGQLLIGKRVQAYERLYDKVQSEVERK